MNKISGKAKADINGLDAGGDAGYKKNDKL
jgi:hypothetical protein